MAKKADSEVAGREDVIARLKGLGTHMLSEIKTEQSPTFETKVRSRSNIFYDENYGVIRLGDKVETRTFLNVAQARKFMQTIAVASKCKKFLDEDAHTSIRGLFYQLKFSLGQDVEESLFEEQSESNPLVEDLEVALNVKREDLNLSTDRKGVVAGNLVLKDKFGGTTDTIDCGKQGRSGWMIPSDVDNGMEFVKCDADYVLVVEKDALWQRLNEDKFWQKENCILITPKGQSSRGCRRLIRKLANKKLPIYVCSIDAEEPILLQDENGFIRNECIGEYVDGTIDKFGSVGTSFYEKSVAGSERAFEVSEDGKSVLGRTLNVVRHPISEELVEVTTNCGFSVKATRSHSVMVFEGYKIIPKSAGELKKGDLLVAPLKVPNNESFRELDCMNLIEREYPALLKKVKKENDRIRFGKSELSFPNKITVTREFARLLGYFVAEGSSGDQVSISFGAHEKKYIDDVVQCVEKSFECPVHIHYPHSTCAQLKFGGCLLSVFFEKVFKCGKLASGKRVPSMVLNMPEEFKLEFLKGYFRGDGNAVVRNKECSLRAITVSRKLASDIILLLLQLGCWGTIRKRKGKENELDAYAITVSNRESLRKLKGIAVDIEPGIASRIEQDIRKSPVYKSIPTRLLKPLQKEFYQLSGSGISDVFSQKTISFKRLRALLSQLNGESVLKRDKILGALSRHPWASTRELCELAGVQHVTVFKALERAERKGLVSSKMKKGDKTWFLNASLEISKEARERINVLKNLAEDEIALIPVKRIQKVESSNGFVYDVEVNPTHTFVGGVGPLLLHNTDCDAWGWYIYWAIKSGSMNLAYLASDIAVPEAKFIGVSLKDLETYDFLKKLTINARDVDIKRAEEMLSYPWINLHKAWVEELKLVLTTKKKLEQDALQGPRLSFVGEYIREKISKKDFLA
ncbi:hypothetical protein HY992_04095 [Candidatus Micrarchaeota archaeon]|nr:hypothetical protein [Candidatus Micrarchaeota archaeon]